MNLSSRPEHSKIRQAVHRRNLDCHRELQVEIVIKLLLSWVLVIGAFAALVKLVPYHFSQQAKLKEIDAQVQETEKRVTKLKAELNRNFDPQQIQNLMEEYSPRLAPNQSRVFWLNPAETTEKEKKPMESKYSTGN